MMGLSEIKWANKNPKLHAARRDEATARRAVGEPKKREIAQAFHGERVLARQKQNRAEVR